MEPKSSRLPTRSMAADKDEEGPSEPIPVAGPIAVVVVAALVTPDPPPMPPPFIMSVGGASRKSSRETWRCGADRLTNDAG